MAKLLERPPCIRKCVLDPRPNHTKEFKHDINDITVVGLELSIEKTELVGLVWLGGM